MPDFPATIFIRDPVLDGVTEIHKELWNDLYDEIEAVQRAMGSTGSTYGSPKRGSASLAARLDAFMSSSGRQKRKVSTYWQLDTTNYNDIKGQVRQYIQVGRTAKVTSGFGNAISVTYGQAYSVAPAKILVQPAVDISDVQYGNSISGVEALRAFVMSDLITTTTFQFKMRRSVNTTSTQSIPTKPFYAFWMAIGGS